MSIGRSWWSTIDWMLTWTITVLRMGRGMILLGRITVLGIRWARILLGRIVCTRLVTLRALPFAEFWYIDFVSTAFPAFLGLLVWPRQGKFPI